MFTLSSSGDRPPGATAWVTSRGSQPHCLKPGRLTITSIQASMLLKRIIGPIQLDGTFLYSYSRPGFEEGVERFYMAPTHLEAIECQCEIIDLCGGHARSASVSDGGTFSGRGPASKEFTPPTTGVFPNPVQSPSTQMQISINTCPTFSPDFTLKYPQLSVCSSRRAQGVRSRAEC